MAKKIGDWKLVDKVQDKTDSWEKYSDGKGNVIDMWRSEPNKWNTTVNGSFLNRGVSKGEAKKSAYWYMRKHSSGGRKNNPNF